MANPFNIEGFGKRFGAMPLPIELSDSAADGELMVSKTTGHIYVRNGSKNVSMTVQLEEFLKAFRVGCINSVRNSGEFFEPLAKDDWYLATSTLAKIKPTFVQDPETQKYVMEFTTSSTDVSWQYIANYIGSYNKLKYKLGTKLCLSFSAKSDKPVTITPRLTNATGSKLLVEFNAVQLTSDYKKFELPIITSKDVLFDKDTLLLFDIGDQKSIKITFEYTQLEPGDRSSAWRPSWLDYYQRMDFLGAGIKEWTKERIVEAINNCKNYTDASILDLSNKTKQWIQNALDQAKDYTNQERDKLNKKINANMDEAIKRDMMQRVHINLGNQDFTKYTSSPEYTKYDNDLKGIVIEGGRTVTLNLPIPIVEDSKYYVRIKGKQLVGDGPIYAGVDSLDANLNTMTTDTSHTFNYGLFQGQTIKENTDFEAYTIFSGYNEKNEGELNKFDPNACYFRVVIIANYQQPESYRTLLSSIEIFEIPKCLWDALTVAEPNKKDGLFSKEDKAKLDTVEEYANNYKHPTGDGNLHVPATGTTNENKVLTAGSKPGELIWKLPSTDSETLDGYDSTDFVMHKDDKPTTFHTMTKYNDIFQEVISDDGTQNGYIKIETPLLMRGKYVNVQLTINTNYGRSEAFISVSGWGSRTEDGFMSNTYGAFCTSNKYGQNIYVVQDPTTRYMTIYIGQIKNKMGDLNIRILSAYSSWDTTADGNRDAWKISCVTGVPSGATTIDYNRYLNAQYLDNKSPKYYARREGDTVSSYSDDIPSYESANMNMCGDNQDSWLVLDKSGSLSGVNKYGIYYRNIQSALNVTGNEPLPMDSFAFIGNSMLHHYLSLSTGDAYHKGNMKSKNIDTGRYSIKYDESEQCLDFIFE